MSADLVFYCAREDCADHLRSIPPRPPNRWANGLWAVRPYCPTCHRAAFWTRGAPGQYEPERLRPAREVSA